MSADTNQCQTSLRQLKLSGVSPWYDNIDRRIIESGELREVINKGILGLTTNPAIFEKAITGSSLYDGQIKEAIQDNLSPELIYDELSITDVLSASDMLMEVYESTSGLDGYVSIETWPRFAYDAKSTLEYARKIFKRLNRPNVMIKVPATEEAREAITQLILEGINVNATLIFSLKDYCLAAQAYIEGLKLRRQRGLDIGSVASVASVFVSRIDARIDGMLEEIAREDRFGNKEDILGLRGKLAVANSTVIYEKYLELFEGGAFAGLRIRGARPQRVLWASTGTKNPAYSDTKYVDELIAEDTVNTIPHATLKDYLEHGKPESGMITRNAGSGHEALDKIAGLGININEVCARLQDEGIKAFQKSFDNLAAAIAAKVKSIP